MIMSGKTASEILATGLREDSLCNSPRQTEFSRPCDCLSFPHGGNVALTRSNFQQADLLRCLTHQ